MHKSFVSPIRRLKSMRICSHSCYSSKDCQCTSISVPSYWRWFHLGFSPPPSYISSVSKRYWFFSQSPLSLVFTNFLIVVLRMPWEPSWEPEHGNIQALLKNHAQVCRFDVPHKRKPFLTGLIYTKRFDMKMTSRILKLDLNWTKRLCVPWMTPYTL